MTPTARVSPDLRSHVQELGLEGMVAKRLDSAWVPRRASSWVKYKATRQLSAVVVVVGMTKGTGSRAATFGALTLGLYDGDRLVEIGEVGSGFTQATLATLLPRVAAGEQFVVEIAYRERAPTGGLRFPVFRGVRPELDAADCTIDQFQEER